MATGFLFCLFSIFFCFVTVHIKIIHSFDFHIFVNQITKGYLFECEDNLHSSVWFFSVLRSESIEMLMTKKLPTEDRSTKEQLKTLCVKLFSLVSCLHF